VVSGSLALDSERLLFVSYEEFLRSTIQTAGSPFERTSLRPDFFFF